MICNKICIPTSKKIDDFVGDKKTAEIQLAWKKKKNQV